MMVETRPVGLFCVCSVGFLFVVLVIFSTIRLSFPPFNDDLGTMPTRRPYLWKKSPCTPCPQQLSPPLFVPWSQVAKLRGVVAVHKDIEACPHEELQVALAHPQCLVPGEKEQFLQVNSDLLCQLQGSVMPLEGIAPQVFEAIYQRQQGEILWVTVLWMIAQLNRYWVGGTSPPLPSVFQINCGGLGGGALEGEVPPHFHCTCPPVGESQVYGPSLSPADVLDEQEWGVAYGWSTGVHEVAALLGYGKAGLLYQRAQHVLQAARLLPAHRRLPHQAFLSGLWWKLLSLQPLRLLAYLPVLGCLRPAEQADPPHFTVIGFSACRQQHWSSDCLSNSLPLASQSHSAPRRHRDAEECLSSTRSHCRT